MGTRPLSHLQPDLFLHSASDAQYSLPNSDLLRLTAPMGVDIEFLITEKESAAPGWDRLPDEDALQMCKQLNEKKQEEKGKPLKGNHVFYHVTFGPQFTSHHPFKIESTRDPRNSAETDLVLAADVNFHFHEDTEGADDGWELTVTMQGSRNFIILDPNRSNPDYLMLPPEKVSRSLIASQAQLQIQLAYVFKTIKAGKFEFSFSLLFQLVGGATVQYDPTVKKNILSWGKGGAYGVGLDISHPSVAPFKLSIQCTQGVSAGGPGVLDFGGPSLDSSCTAGPKFEWK
jgi:hypothetical protein